MKKVKEAGISRRGVLRAAGAGAIAAPFLNLGSFRVFAGDEHRYVKRVVELVESSLVIDMLSLLNMPRRFSGDQGENPFAYTRQELIDIKSYGIDVLHPASGTANLDVREEVLAFLAGLNGLVAEHPELLMRVDSAADLELIAKRDKLGLIPGTQNAAHFETVEDVKQFYYCGQRIAQLTYNTQNLIGSGSTDRVDGGISDFGAQVVAAMNELGMAVDVSHCGDRTTLDAFELSSKPVLITHSNVRELAGGHPRCKPDEAIRAMGRAGSVMGITGVRQFVSAKEPTTMRDWGEHVDYVARLTGIEHVGIGSDMDPYGYDALPEAMNRELRQGYKASYAFRDKIDTDGFDQPRKIYAITEELVRRGYGDDDIRGVLGRNFQRVLGEIWG